MKRWLVQIAAALLPLTFAFACSTASGATDADWPIEIEKDGAKFTLYQPQPESLENDRLTARAAVSVQGKADAQPMFGAVWIDARVATDRDARTVTLIDLDVTEVRFPNAAPERESEVAGALKSELPKHEITWPLDSLLTTLDQADIRKASADGINIAPPKIVFATHPTVLVTIDGKPKMQAVEGSQTMRVVNTPFVILFAPSTKSYYLHAGERWMKSADYVGPWQVDPSPPKEVTSALAAPSSQPPAGAPPQSADVSKDADILVVTEPTELVVSDGEPKWTPVEGNDLLYLANSDNEVFLEVATQQYYVLLSGRWFRGPSLTQGPWANVASDALPASFAKIPRGSERGNVRTFVAGTDEARDAVLDASIPQTSAVSRTEAKCTVTFDGDAKFDKITGTRMSYAINASQPVIELDGSFYCCQQGVWFTASSPFGPWTVCTSIPDDVHSIPPSCPVHPVSYVYVYDSTPQYVYVGYLPGYTGCYVYGPTIVYGTGWWYPGWYGTVYYPHPCTWGFAAHYNPWTCGWSFGVGYGWGVSASWFSASYGWGHPGWWGPSGFHCDHFDIHGRAVQFHPPPGPHGGFVHGGAVVTFAGRENLYQRPENIARAPVKPTLTHAGPAAERVRGMRAATSVPNDVFADHDGRVLRRTTSGWQEHAADGWKPTDRVQRPSASPSPSSARPGAQQPGSVARPGAEPGATRTSPQPSAPRPSEEAPRPPVRSAPPEPSQPRSDAPIPRERPAASPATPSAPPATTPGRTPRRPPSSVAPRQDFERMNNARQQGSSRASDFQQRSGRGGSRPQKP